MMWAAERVKEGQSSDKDVYCPLCSVSFFSFLISISHTVCFFLGSVSKRLSELILLMPFPINDTHLTRTQAQHTHLYICDLQSAILHQGHSRFISLKSLAVLLPRNPD